MNGRVTTGLILSGLSNQAPVSSIPVITNRPIRPCDLTLIEVLSALKKLKDSCTQQRGIISAHILAHPTFQWYLKHYTFACIPRLIRLFELALDSRSPDILLYLEKKQLLLNYIAGYLDPAQAETYLYSLLLCNTNSKLLGAIGTITHTLLTHWDHYLGFNLDSICLKLKERSALVADSTFAKEAHQRFLNRLKNHVSITKPNKRFHCDFEPFIEAPSFQISLPPQADLPVQVDKKEEIVMMLDTPPQPPATAIVINKPSPAPAPVDNSMNVFLREDSKDAMLCFDDIPLGRNHF